MIQRCITSEKTKKIKPYVSCYISSRRRDFDTSVLVAKTSGRQAWHAAQVLSAACLLFLGHMTSTALNLISETLFPEAQTALRLDRLEELPWKP